MPSPDRRAPAGFRPEGCRVLTAERPPDFPTGIVGCQCHRAPCKAVAYPQMQQNVAFSKMQHSCRGDDDEECTRSFQPGLGSAALYGPASHFTDQRRTHGGPSHFTDRRRTSRTNVRTHGGPSHFTDRRRTSRTNVRTHGRPSHFTEDRRTHGDRRTSRMNRVALAFHAAREIFSLAAPCLETFAPRIETAPRIENTSRSKSA